MISVSASEAVSPPPIVTVGKAQINKQTAGINDPDNETDQPTIDRKERGRNGKKKRKQLVFCTIGKFTKAIFASIYPKAEKLFG